MKTKSISFLNKSYSKIMHLIMPRMRNLTTSTIADSMDGLHQIFVRTLTPVALKEVVEKTNS